MHFAIREECEDRLTGAIIDAIFIDTVIAALLKLVVLRIVTDGLYQRIQQHNLAV
jgi:hypothetical protein